MTLTQTGSQRMSSESLVFERVLSCCCGCADLREHLCMCAQARVHMLFINVHTCLPNIWPHLSI